MSMQSGKTWATYLIVLILCLGVVEAWAVYELNPTIDTFYSPGNPANGGASSSLSVGTVSGVTEYFAMLKFNLNQFSVNSTVNNATLKVFFKDTGSGGDFNYCSLHRVTSSWDEATFTGNDPNFNTNGSGYSGSGTDSVVNRYCGQSNPTYVLIDVTSLANSIIQNNTDYGIILRSYKINSTSTSYNNYYSRETASKPVLMINVSGESISNFYLNDSVRNLSISNFSIILTNITTSKVYFTKNGLIRLNDSGGINGVYNITFSDYGSGRYYNAFYPDYNIGLQQNNYFKTTPLEYVEMKQLYNLRLFNGTYFVRSLIYSLNYSCSTNGDSYIIYNRDGSKVSSNVLSCNNESILFNTTYNPTNESLFTLSWSINNTYGPIFNTPSYSFNPDLNSPVIYRYGINNSFQSVFNNPFSNLTLGCYDTKINTLTYNISRAGNIITTQTLNGYSNLSWNDTFINGFYNYAFECSDIFGTTTINLNASVNYKSVILWDEVDNSAFGLINITGAKIYYGSNQTSFNFKTANNNTVNVACISDCSFRIELFNDNQYIDRYIDIGLVEQNPVKVCTNKNYIIYYEQLITSNQIRKAKLKNNYAGCYVAADYTKFNYQGGKLLRAWTTNGYYSLSSSNDAGASVDLGNVDGAKESSIDLDTLLFNINPVLFNVYTDQFIVLDCGSSTYCKQVNYVNPNSNTLGMNITITRTDTNQVVYTNDAFSNYNNITILFDYSTFYNVSNSTVFEIVGIKRTTYGYTTLKHYFSIALNSTTRLSVGYALTMSILLVVFGLTFTVSRLSFSWFGLFVMVAAMVPLTMTTQEWFIRFFQVIEGVIFLFIGILMVTKNPGEVSA